MFTSAVPCLYEFAALVAPVYHSLTAVPRKLRLLIPLSILLSLAPLPVGWWLGNGGEPVFALLAPLTVLIVSGLVCVSWLVLVTLMTPIGFFARMTGIGYVLYFYPSH